MLEMTCITRGRGPPAGWITRAQLSCNGDHGADQAVVRHLRGMTESAATATRSISSHTDADLRACRRHCKDMAEKVQRGPADLAHVWASLGGSSGPFLAIPIETVEVYSERGPRPVFIYFDTVRDVVDFDFAQGPDLLR